MVLKDFERLFPVVPVHEQGDAGRAGDEVVDVDVRLRDGGDEFVVVSRRAWSVMDVPVLADRVFAATSAPIDLAAVDERLRVGVSIGIAVGRCPSIENSRNR